MSETLHILTETCRKLFSDLFTAEDLGAAEQGRLDEDKWRSLVELGLPFALVPEAAGGVGLTVSEALAIVKIAGEFAVPLPLAETMLANWLIAQCGLDPLDGPLAVAPVNSGDRLQLARASGNWRLIGTACRVPGGRFAKTVVVVADKEGESHLLLVSPDGYLVDPDSNLAGEPRDLLQFDAVVAPERVAPAGDLTSGKIRAAGAALRCAGLAGAISRVLRMTTEYASERVQFGKPIGKFQAIQQSLAVMAGQAAAAAAAADLAAEALEAGGNLLAIAAAKVRCGEAAGIVAPIAHQVHGAMGFSSEHSLHFFTKRLWAWREEYGNEAEWSQLIGRRALAAGADGLWPLIVAA